MSKAKIEEPTVSVDGLRVSTYMLIAGAVILFVFSGYMWNRFVLGSDNRIFWDSVGNGLSTDGVRVVADDSTVDTTRRVTIKLDTSGELGVEARSEFKNATTDSIIRTLSTKERDYLYYEKNENLQQPRLKEFEGTWVDIGAADQTESKTLADQFVNGSLLLIGNLPSSDRKKLINQMKQDKVYEIIGFGGNKRINGVDTKIYRLRINSIGYNASLKSYFGAMGLSEAAAQISDSGADGLQPEVELAIDPKRRVFVAAGYPTLDSTGAREYDEWNTQYKFDLPTDSITAEELQSKLDTIYTPTTTNI